MKFKFPIFQISRIKLENENFEIWKFKQQWNSEISKKNMIYYCL